ncbi:synaptic vesicle 2-related protein [Trichonephila inaurata madagascariensis]|uniref:Synaptic vesicle 2-related protein n=1 Tax=Trichonephila inaurata madagascariensis TaxID=2747483 RepID=A0A8X6XNU0_9ARAC|nr:synaptic vesicle 2-related protein [Trichonephila inaurata madagascariensis]
MPEDIRDKFTFARKSTDHRGYFRKMTVEEDVITPTPNENKSSILIISEAFTTEDAINRVGFGKFQAKLIILSGFVWMAKSFHTVLENYINSLTTCDWSLLRWHAAFMVTLTTVCTVFGCILYGIVSDIYGRRTALTSSLIFAFVFSAVSVGLPGYIWFLVFRAIAAFSTGGFAQALTLCCEYIPGNKRGRVFFILSCFWAVGVVAMLGILYATTRPYEYHWRLFAAVGTIPAFIAMVMMRFFPESLHFLVVSNEYDSAKNIAAELARSNCKALPRGQLHPVRNDFKRGNICHLLSAVHARSTLLFWYMGLTTAIAFFSLDAMSPYYLGDVVDNKAINSTASNFMGDLFKPVRCMQNVTGDEFVKILWTNALDFPGFIVYMLLVDVIDRKKLLCASYLLTCLFIGLLFLKTEDTLMLASFIFCARTLLLGQIDMLLLMTSETFPTTVRGTAVGVQMSTFYLGFFLTPYISAGFLNLELEFLAGFCCVIAFIAAIASALLTWETRGLELADTPADR